MEKTTEISINSYLSFQIGQEMFAVNVGKVLEILELPRITKVPMAPSYMRGVINLRGNVLPVVDTRLRIGLKENPPTVDTCIIVLNITFDDEAFQVGALVDAVQEVLDMEDDQIAPPPGIGSKYRSEFIKGMGKAEDAFIMILDIDQFFSLDELLDIRQQTTEKIKKPEG